MPIEHIPDGKGYREVVTGHTRSIEGRTVIPSSTGPNRGGQMGVDNSVGRKSTIIGAGGQVLGEVDPAAAQKQAQPGRQDAQAPIGSVRVPSTRGMHSTPANPPVATPEPPAAPVRLPTPPPAVREAPETCAPVPQEPPATKPGVSVSLVSQAGATHVVSWRGRYHRVIPTPVALILVWNLRHDDESPLLPPPIEERDESGGESPAKLTARVRGRDGTDQEFSIVNFGIEFRDGDTEYFVLLRV